MFKVVQKVINSINKRIKMITFLIIIILLINVNICSLIHLKLGTSNPKNIFEFFKYIFLPYVLFKLLIDGEI